MQPRPRVVANVLLATALVSGAAIAGGCSTTPSTRSERAALSGDVQAFVSRTKETDPSIKRFFENCAGYAAIPSIAKG